MKKVALIWILQRRSSIETKSRLMAAAVGCTRSYFPFPVQYTSRTVVMSSLNLSKDSSAHTQQRNCCCFFIETKFLCRVSKILRGRPQRCPSFHFISSTNEIFLSYIGNTCSKAGSPVRLEVYEELFLVTLRKIEDKEQAASGCFPLNINFKKYLAQLNERI